MTVTTNLSAIQSKVRRLTGRLSINQLSDINLNEYINNYYQYRFPEEYRSFNLKTTYEINLEPNVQEYTFPSNEYISVENPCYVSGYKLNYMQDVQAFYSMFSVIKEKNTLTSGTGIAGPYAGLIGKTPIIKGSVFISTVDALGNSLLAVDNGLGSFIDENDVAIAGSTLDYETGVITGITFTAVVPAAETIYVQFLPYQAARPTSVLFFDDTFKFWPIPDTAYQFTITAYVRPTYILAGQSPLLNEWWELISYGAALDILGDTLDMDGYAKVKAMFDHQMCLAERRTIKQLSNQRAKTIYDGYDSALYPGSYTYS